MRLRVDKKILAMRGLGEGPALKINPLTHRKCRICSKKLRADRYFSCSHHRELDYRDMEDEYGFAFKSLK